MRLNFNVVLATQYKSQSQAIDITSRYRTISFKNLKVMV